MTCQEAFRTIAHACLDDLVANHAATCEGDQEALHQMRIALTRLRAAQSFFSPIIARSEWARLKGEFKWLNRYLSTARDMDVALKRLHSTPDKQPQANAVDQTWRQTSDASHRHLNRALRSQRYRRLVRDTAAFIETGHESPDSPKPPTGRPTPSLAAYSADRLDRWCRKLLKKSRTIETMGRGERHRLRIKSKRLYYAIEFFASLAPDKSLSTAKALLKFLRKIRKRLGHLNDMEKGRSIATTLTKPERSGLAGRHSPFDQTRKEEKRTIKATLVAFRQMTELKPDWNVLLASLNPDAA